MIIISCRPLLILISVFPQVIPLSQCSGIVEWCEGTIPIGEYLIGTSSNPTIGAHARYRPKDWPGMECRRKFAVSKWAGKIDHPGANENKIL